MSARAVHRRPGWCAALSASHRIGHYEHGNGENLRGWHTGSGMLYWWRGARRPVLRLLLADRGPVPAAGHHRVHPAAARRAGAGWGDTGRPWRWVGGASDGTYAAVGQHLSGLESTMEAFKSCFFLDDAIVLPWGGITGADGVAVETVVDNRRNRPPRSRWARGGRTWKGHGVTCCPGSPCVRGRERRNGGAAGPRHVTLWLDPRRRPALRLLRLPPVYRRERADTGPAPGPAGHQRARPPCACCPTPPPPGLQLPGLRLTAACFWNAGTVGRALTGLRPVRGPWSAPARWHATVTVADPRGTDELTLTWARPVAELLGRATPSLTGGRLAFRAAGRPECASVTVTVRHG
ncbi:hypothetical protein GCM10020220_031820 [Nonomuraea rubra]